MAAPWSDNDLASWPDADRLLKQFEEAWRSGNPPRLETYLSPLATSGQAGNAPARQQFLNDLIRMDLEYGWQRARAGPGALPTGPLLEDYARRYPELPGVEPLWLQLIGEEYRARCRWGDRPGHTEYGARFPQQAPRLNELLRRIDAELAAEFGRGAAANAFREGPARTMPGLFNAQPTVRPLHSVAALLDELQQTQLLSPGQWSELGPADVHKQFADPKALAGSLLKRGWLTAYQVNQLLQGRAHDLVLGPYQLLERLGEGGAGQVFKARHQKMDRVVALKIIRKELLSDGEAVARFYREIEVVSRLDHPNVVHAYDAGPVGATHFLAMEYVEGTDLGRLVKQGGRLPVAQACEYIRQAACGLAHAHERGLVHRDIKPHNLIMSLREGLVKVADLGLARLPRALNEEATVALTGQRSTGTLTPENAIMIGTADYLAPEQAIDFHEADIRADIYSLGCTFYFLLTGQPPFAGGTLAQKVVKHMQTAPPAIGQFRSDVPSAVSQVLHTMLAKRPQDRYQTPVEVSQALAEYSRPGPALSVRGRLLRYVPWRTWGRRRALLGLAGVLAVAALVPGWFWLFGGTPYQRLRRKLTDPDTEVNQGWQFYQRFCTRYPGTPEADKAQDLMWQFLIDVRARVPGTSQAIEAGKLLTQLPSPLDQLVAGADPDNGDVVAQLGQRGQLAVVRMAFSPDCKLVAAARENNVIDIWDSATAKKSFTLSGHQAPVTSLLFSPRSKLLVSSSYDKTIKLWDLTTGKERTWEVPRAVFLAFAPDGKTLAAGAYDQASVTLYDVDTAQKKSLKWDETKRPTSLVFSPDGRTLAVTNYTTTPILWDLAAEKAREITGLPTATSVAFSPDSKTLALGVADGPIQLWDLADGKQRKTLDDPGSRGFLAFTPDGKKLLTGDLRLWDVVSGQKLWQARTPGPANALATDGRHVAVPYVFAGFIFRIPGKFVGR
jgi:serine/threonine protein kinase